MAGDEGICATPSAFTSGITTLSNLDMNVFDDIITQYEKTIPCN